MRDVLFVTWAGGGNVHPLVALGSRLAARGHHVRVLGPGELRGRFESAGLAFRPHRTGAEWLGRDDEVAWPANDEEQAAFVRGMAADVTDEIGRARTDLAVVDFMQPQALSAAEAAGIPFVAFVHTLYARLPRGAFSPMALFAGVDGLNALRAELGLGSVADNNDLLDLATLTMVTTVPELDRPDEVPPNVRYVGPILEAAGTVDVRSMLPAGGSPLVVASMGTTSMDEAPVVRRVIDALAASPVRGLVTVGEHLQPHDFATPGNVVVSGFVPHTASLPEADLFVGHAGLGGISAALTFGVPMVLAPLGRDQPANGAHVEAVGAGVTVSKDASSDEFRSAIAGVLGDETYRKAALAIASCIERYEDGAVAVAELEALM